MDRKAHYDVMTNDDPSLIALFGFQVCPFCYLLVTTAPSHALA